MSRHLNHVVGASAAKRKAHGQKKVGVVMGEFKGGRLHSSGGALVTKRAQAVAIAMSEPGLSRQKKRRRTILGAGSDSDYA